MAFSPVHEIEIDSSYRLASSNSSTDFEYELPFTWPTMGPCQIRLSACYIPNTFPTLPTVTVQTNVGGVITLATLNLDLGNYGFTSAAARMTERIQQAAPEGCGVSTLSIVYDDNLKRYYFIDTVGAASISVTSTWLQIFGHSSATFPLNNGGAVSANTRYYMGGAPSFPVENFHKFYIRIQSFENKVILPNKYNTHVTYSVPLDNYLSYKDVWAYDNNTTPQQKVMVYSSYFNTNNLLKIQLIDRNGAVVNLNQRNWLMTLRVEPANYVDT